MFICDFDNFLERSIKTSIYHCGKATVREEVENNGFLLNAFYWLLEKLRIRKRKRIYVAESIKISHFSISRPEMIAHEDENGTV